MLQGNKNVLWIIMGFLGVIFLVINISMILDFAEARKFQQYDIVTATIEKAHAMTYDIDESTRKSSSSSTRKTTYRLSIYQTIEIGYEYNGTTYHKTMENLLISSSSYSSRNDAQRAVDTFDGRLYQDGGRVDVYTNGEDVRTVADVSGKAGAGWMFLLAGIDVFLIGMGAIFFKNRERFQ